MQLIKTIEQTYKKLLHGNRVKMDFVADGLGVIGRNMSFLVDEKFDRAWQQVAEFNKPYWNGETPDVRWRAHLVVWAAHQALQLKGDFAEFGVNTGIFSSMIYRLTELAETDRKFFLFDTYEGIPVEQSSQSERANANLANQVLYKHDAYAVAKEAFSDYENAVLVKGRLPDSLSQVKFDKLCFASIDLNVTKPEIEVIEAIWDILVPGALVVLDDYNFASHIEQHNAWNEFAKSRQRLIFQSPTGQGLLIR